MSQNSEIPPGPNAGRTWRDPPENYRDPLTGRSVLRVTGYRGHSHHQAGPMPCWLEGGERLIVVSDREGHGNLFVHHFLSGVLTQLTDLRGGDRPRFARLTQSEQALEFWYGDLFYELELGSLKMRTRRPTRPLAAVDRRKNSRHTASLRVGQTAARLGRPSILWLANSAALSSRRALLRLDSAGVPARASALPCLDPQQTRVVFGAEAEGYQQIFTVEIGRFDQLPSLASVMAEPRRLADAAWVPRPMSPRA